jgi:hypothetical protein
MKKLMPYIVSVILLFASSCVSAQNNSTEKQVENMLLEFYSKLFYIHENSTITSSVPPDMVHRKLDSLIRIYCSSKLRNEAKKIMDDGYGHDLLTKDYVGDSNENLKVEKDRGNENEFNVSFVVTYSDAPGGPIKKHVVLHVILIKEKDGYKIDDVK